MILEIVVIPDLQPREYLGSSKDFLLCSVVEWVGSITDNVRRFMPVSRADIENKTFDQCETMQAIKIY